MNEIYLEKKIITHPNFKKSIKSVIKVIKKFTIYERRNKFKKINSCISIYNDEKFDDNST